ncbi:hypothetical protein Tco_1379462 [Tanacetum coccineum]
MMSQKRRKHARENSTPPHGVLTNDDLLTKILIRLHILCIHLFTTVSKQWLRILTYHVFTLNRSQITKVDPPIGLFVNHIRSLFECDFVSLDSKLQLKKSAVDSSFTLCSTEEADNVKILQSCIGLLLCVGSRRHVLYYVYNPSTNQFKRLLYPDCSLDNSPYYRSAGLRMAFDPTKSPHYKLVDVGRTSCDIDIQIYSLKTVPEGWSIQSTTWSIILGEKEEDSFLVINFSRKVVQYNLISKTLHNIYDYGSNQLDDNHDDDELLQQFEAEHIIYEFISSFANV